MLSQHDFTWLLKYNKNVFPYDDIFLLLLLIYAVIGCVSRTTFAPKVVGRTGVHEIKMMKDETASSGLPLWMMSEMGAHYGGGIREDHERV